MNINCMNDKIANAHNPLKPIILSAILNIYQNGNNEISAQMVKIECAEIDNTIIWNNRIPAICSAMRNSLDCGGRIIGEDRDFNGFTITFGSDNLKQVIQQKTSETNSLKTKENKENSLKSIVEKDPKNIFLITCSSRKIKENELSNNPFELESLSFNDELKDHRVNLIKLITNPETVHLRKEKSIINNINFSKSELAHLVYSEGKFYNKHAAFSKDWAIEVSRKIYIVSALFGLIRADDYIPLYDLAMNDTINNSNNFAQKFWKDKLDNIIMKLHKNDFKILNLLSNDYSNCFNEQSKDLLIIPKIEFTRSDAPSKRGKWLKSVLQ